ncbi:nuclear transport factor 2 family protein [Microbacterium sp. C7(2022)]|uniref:nuclear transport factor 2 family protein n=1 Tax=Microbacterium sp. C7(2022) TaxID=2992759 RepID=UPI00237AC467|nr:nuclear transport factor 2 family protein [Microbacterium sp. C7(2022)]MDE0547098.1 nuclear transport factor 2 family protein [Microbacterium sp. C7(2022)]
MSNAQRFLDGYLDAWRTNDGDSIRALFTEDATYRGSARHLDPATGIDAIVALWDEERDAPETWSYSGGVDLETPGHAVIRGTTTYTDGVKAGAYANVWLVRFDESGKACEFQDWWFPQEA